jgi:hypothetical protein
MNFVLSKKTERKGFVISNIQKYNFLRDAKNNNEPKKPQENIEENTKIEEVCEIENIRETIEENTKIEEVCDTETIEENTKIDEVCETETIKENTKIDEGCETETFEEKISVVDNKPNYYIDDLYEDNIKSFDRFDQKESLNKLVVLINEILDRIEPEELFDYKLIIKDKQFPNFEETLNVEYIPVSQNHLIDNNEPKKLTFNMNKIKNIVDKKNEQTEITTKDLLLKMNNVVSKINIKLETEMNKDLFTFSEIMTSESSRKNVLNLICFSVLNRIDNFFN